MPERLVFLDSGVRRNDDSPKNESNKSLNALTTTLPWADILRWLKSHQEILGWATLLSFLMFVGTLLAVPLIVIELPEHYLTEAVDEKPRSHVRHWPYLIFKNLVGAALALAGLVMLVLPGQGLLTLFIGLGLMNLPGKRRLVHGIIGQRRVFSAVNRLRVRAGKPPLAKPE